MGISDSNDAVSVPASGTEVSGQAAEQAVGVCRSLKRALLVDDEPVVRRIIARMLGSLGYEALEARDGSEALALYAEHHASLDVVLLDFVLPKMDGHELFAAMRAVNPKVPVIMSSGCERDVVMLDERAEGLGGFLAKPYGRAQLLDILGV